MFFFVIVVLSLLSASNAREFHLYAFVETSASPRSSHHRSYEGGSLATIWKDKHNWYDELGAPLHQIPGAGDDVYIDVGASENCPSNLAFLYGRAVVRSVTIGSSPASCPNGNCFFVLILNGKLRARNVTVLGNAELRMGPGSRVHSSTLVVEAGGYLGGSGIIVSPHSEIYGTLNPYDEAVIQEEYAATQTSADSSTSVENRNVAGHLQFKGNLILDGATVEIDLGGYLSYDKISVERSLTVESSTILLATTVQGDLSYRIFLGEMKGTQTGNFTVSQSVFGGSFYRHFIVDACMTTPHVGYNPLSSVSGLYSSKRSLHVPRGSTSATVCTGNGFGVLLTAQSCPKTCPAHYSSPPDCSSASCTTVAPDCNGNGVCVGAYPNLPACKCNSNHEGSYCEVAICPGGNCNYHGTCVGGSSKNPYCNCDSGWTGVDCSIPICNPYCQNGGTCFNSEGAQECSCQDGYYGPACASKTCAECANGGACNSATGNCICKDGWVGNSCTTSACTQDCGAGRCHTNGNCYCPNGITPWNYYCQKQVGISSTGTACQVC